MAAYRQPGCASGVRREEAGDSLPGAPSACFGGGSYFLVIEME